MTDPIDDPHVNDPNPDTAGAVSPVPLCSVCGKPIHADLAGPEHDEPADHEAVAPDDQ